MDIAEVDGTVLDIKGFQMMMMMVQVGKALVRDLVQYMTHYSYFYHHSSA